MRLVDAAEFNFDTEGLGALGEPQRAFLDLAEEVVRRTRPVHLAVDAIDVSIEQGSLAILLPHRTDEECVVMVIVSDAEAVVAYSHEHEHFWPDDPAHGREWPVDAPDYVEAAARLLEQILLGRVELEVRRGFVLKKIKSYLIEDNGDRAMFLGSAMAMPTVRRHPPKLIRFDFGGSQPPEALPPVN